MFVSLQADTDKLFEENRTREYLAEVLLERRRRAHALKDPHRQVELARVDLAGSLLPFLRGEALAAVYGQFFLAQGPSPLRTGPRHTGKRRRRHPPKNE